MEFIYSLSRIMHKKFRYFHIYWPIAVIWLWQSFSLCSSWQIVRQTNFLTCYFQFEKRFDFIFVYLMNKPTPMPCVLLQRDMNSPEPASLSSPMGRPGTPPIGRLPPPENSSYSQAFMKFAVSLATYVISRS